MECEAGNGTCSLQVVPLIVESEVKQNLPSVEHLSQIQSPIFAYQQPLLHGVVAAIVAPILAGATPQS